MHLLMSFRIQASNAEEMEKIALPYSFGGEGGEVGVPRNLFPRDFALGTPGTCVWREPVHWHWSILIRCIRVRAWTDMLA